MTLKQQIKKGLKGAATYFASTFAICGVFFYWILSMNSEGALIVLKPEELSEVWSLCTFAPAFIGAVLGFYLASGPDISRRPS